MNKLIQVWFDLLLLNNFMGNFRKVRLPWTWDSFSFYILMFSDEPGRGSVRVKTSSSCQSPLRSVVSSIYESEAKINFIIYQQRLWMFPRQVCDFYDFLVGSVVWEVKLSFLLEGKTKRERWKWKWKCGGPDWWVNVNLFCGAAGWTPPGSCCRRRSHQENI